MTSDEKLQKVKDIIYNEEVAIHNVNLDYELILQDILDIIETGE